MRTTILILTILLVATVQAAEPPPQPTTSDIRGQDFGAVMQQENEKWRDYIETRDVAIDQQIRAEVDGVYSTIDSELKKVKFIFPILMFCAVLSAMELHSLLQRRRDRAYNQVLMRNAERTVRGMDYAEGQRSRLEENILRGL